MVLKTVAAAVNIVLHPITIALLLLDLHFKNYKMSIKAYINWVKLMSSNNPRMKADVNKELNRGVI